jgi:hypothetical protein
VELLGIEQSVSVGSQSILRFLAILVTRSLCRSASLMTQEISMPICTQASNRHFWQLFLDATVMTQNLSQPVTLQKIY